MTKPMPYHSVRAGFFETLYRSNPDPWNFATSGYEQGKYAATLAALGGRRFANALEIGCSIGVLTERLGPRCDGLLAIDVAVTALDAARARCAGQRQIRFEGCSVPERFPDERFDLILISEVLYFLGGPGIDALAARVCRALLPGACVLAVNWLGDTGTALAGDAAAERFIGACACTLSATLQRRAESWRLDLLRP